MQLLVLVGLMERRTRRRLRPRYVTYLRLCVSPVNLVSNLMKNEREYNSDNLDESESERPATKKRKLSKAAEAKLKAQAKAKAKAKKGKKKGDDDDYSDDEGGDEEDIYTALSKMRSDNTKPANGSLIECAKCENQFSVVRISHNAIE
jgi:DNA repair protein RAD7